MSIQLKRIAVYHNGNADQRILDSIQCKLAQGSITLLVGHTGAGKSTLLDVVTGMIPPDEGEVLYDQSSIWKKRSNGKKERLHPDVLIRNGIVFQFPEQQLFAKDIQAEFTYSLRPYHFPKQEIQARTKQALQYMGLQEDLLTQSPFTLSVGQKRRVVLANVFATDESWLFLDEPTSGLDPTAAETFLHHLLEWKQRMNGSLVIATHDLDTFLPIADQVLVLNHGRLIETCAPHELLHKPNLLQEVSIGLPQQLKTQTELKRYGFKFVDGFMTPEVMANRILEQLQASLGEQIDSNRQQANEAVECPEQIMKQTAATKMACNEAAFGENRTRLSNKPTGKRISTMIRLLDPRAKWLFYIAVSIGILLQHTWTGLVISSILSLSVVYVCGASIRNLWRTGKAFYFFVLISTVISGLQFGGRHPLSLSIPQAVGTLHHLYPFVLIMWLGMLLPFTTSQNEMKQGLEKSLSKLNWMRFPVEAFALGTSLMFRFVPMIKRDIDRFSKIVRTRGKRNSKPGAIHLRDLHVVMIPLVISLIQHAEKVAIAMEARGYKKTGQKRTSSIQLKFTGRDWLTVVIAIFVIVLLVLIRNVRYQPLF